MFRRIFLTIICLTLITSCGFKLRGSAVMLANFTAISIEGGESTLSQKLSAHIQRGGGNVVAVGGADARLVITRTDYQKSVRTRDATGLATSYEYTYTVDYRFLDRKNSAIQSNSSVTQHSILEYSASEELEAQREEELLKQEMENELVLRIVKRLSRA